ncbi:MAG: ABC transporter ATP-binding protein [Mangrovibacterium sp.]
MKISIEGLTKVYPNGHKAINDLTFDIHDGMFGLLGPNGAGKSSLMRILVTLAEPTSGKVTIGDYDLVKDREQVRKMIGYLPQDFRFFSSLKTYEFLDYTARLSGLHRKKERAQKVDQMLEEVGLFEARDRYANRLSGGMKRRLGIAQALMNGPKVVVVDEPTTGLDPEERIRFRNLLSTISTKDVIIILSTHIVGDISSTCNSMVLLNQGELAYTGSPDDIVAQAKGKVWRIKASHDEFNLINERFPVVATVPMGSGWEMEVVAENVNGFHGELMAPNLEHAYVYFMEKSLNLWTASDQLNK